MIKTSAIYCLFRKKAVILPAYFKSIGYRHKQESSHKMTNLLNDNE